MREKRATEFKEKLKHVAWKKQKSKESSRQSKDIFRKV